MSPSLRHRLWFLAAGNLVLLAFLYSYTLRYEQASFLNELSRLGPNVAPRILAGIGLTGVIFVGAIDLSIGSIVVVAGTMFGILYHHGAGPPVCFAACFLTAWALSTLNGHLIRWLRIPPIIVTLAGLAFYRGLAMIIADLGVAGAGEQITIHGDAFHAPGRDYAGSILLIVIAGVLWWEAFGKTPRLWLAVGESDRACRLKGLDPTRLRQSAYTIGGVFLGLAALTAVTNQLTVEPARMARGFELDVIGAVVLGGTNIFGGEGSFAGTVLGGIFLYLVGQAMLYAGVSEYWRTAVEGAVIITVIGFDCAMHRRRKLLEELR